MGMSEREYHIKVLENLLSHYKAREQCEGYYDSTLYDNVEALEYAISSLKTDLKYDLMYEGEEIYTKSDMAAMLTDIQLEIEELYPKARKTYRDGLTSYCEGVDDSREIIQEKINTLKDPENPKECRTCRNFKSNHGVCDICQHFSYWTRKEQKDGRV